MTDTEQLVKKPDLTPIKAYINNDLDLTNKHIEHYVQSDIALTHTIVKRLIAAGGKRIRPTMTLLSAHLFGYQGQQHALLAAIVEILHTATLLHDDVVDNSHLRRGLQAAQVISNNPTAILSGDFLYSRCFQMMIELDSMAILSVLANASNQITQGELKQLTSSCQRLTTETYLEIITGKTAQLFMAASECAAILAGLDHDAKTQARQFGYHFGLAYQLIDDALDYQGHDDALGKKAGDDLADGKVTMPILYALNDATKAEAESIMQAIEHKDRQQFDTIAHILQRYDSIDKTRALAQNHQQEALACLNQWASSPSHPMMVALLDFIVARSH